MVDKSSKTRRKDSEQGSFMPNRRSFLKLTGAAGGTALASGTAAAQSAEEMLADAELPAEDEKPLVRLVSTGGTIASTEEAAEGAGYDLSEQADAIVDSVPLLDYFIDIEIEEVAQKGSSSLLIEDYIGVAKAAKQAEADGADGVIVTHGTSAIEEDAYFNDLVLDLDIPVAFVGAMRPADAVTADGPSNLLTAARMITRNEFHLDDKPSGVYVVLNETVHAARDVTKSDTWALETFDSGSAGPIARFTDDEMQLYREPGSYSSDLSGCDLNAASEMTVPIVTTGAGVEAPLIEQAISGEYDADGFTLQTTGRGGTSPGITDASQAAIDAGIPVASGTRTYYGPLGPSDEAGTVIAMENLPAWKVRVHLIVALTITRDIEEIRETVEEGKYGTAVVAPSAL